MRPAVAIPLLVVAGVVVGAGIFELALRIAVPGAPDLRALHLAEPDKPWLYRLRPGAEAELDKTGGIHYRVNADGFRGPRYAREHPDGAFRIAVLGDSLTFGFGVDEADVYTAQLESLVARSLAPRKVEVLNFGVGGYNAYNEAALYEGIAADYAPDLVLVQFCINDLNDPRLHFDAHTLRLLDLPDAAFPDPAVRALPMPDKSPLAFCAGRLRLCDLLQHALFEDRADRRAVARAVAPRASLRGAEREWLRARYGELAHAAAAHGAAFGVIVFPYPKQLQEPPRDQLPRDIAELGREDGWAAIDLTPAYRAAMSRGDDKLFLDLWHPTPLGHRVAAQALAEELPRLGLVPAAQGVGAR
ncbi:MAG TPA: SGNH/GDSL hydrolase family protein [Myxococcota bacterium]|nr:SGNH/GDSL hydrolase family protein [Myxococcota bacterium]